MADFSTVKIISIKVAPNKKEDKVICLEDGSLVVWLKSKPIEGKANDRLIRVLSLYLGVPKSLISIKSGHKSRQKVIEITS